MTTTPKQGNREVCAQQEQRIIALERENARLRGHAEAIAKALERVQERWRFTNGQQHAHTWHDWADCQPEIKQSLASFRADFLEVKGKNESE